MIHTGDCIEVMASLEPDSVDAIVTDPPYGLEFMGKGWDSGHKLWGGTGDGGLFEPDKEEHPSRKGRKGPAFRLDKPRFLAGHSFQAWCEAWSKAALRVTKPGGYLLAFGGTRTHHRLVCGLEDAGWIIRDELDWIYASGFPKGKANLKPAHEPIVLARKPGPLRPLAIDECRIEAPPWSKQDGDSGAGFMTGKFMGAAGLGQPTQQGGMRESSQGRWPSNLLLSDPALFDEPNAEVVGSGAVVSSGLMRVGTLEGRPSIARNPMPESAMEQDTYGDSGGYSRFFIVPKADRGDREPVLRGQIELSLGKIGNHGNLSAGDDLSKKLGTNNPRENAHPTVKPTDLMRHLVRLVTPQGGTVLDCFLGSGSTAIAAELEGFAWIGIEKEPEYVAIAEARLNGTQKGLGLAL